MNEISVFGREGVFFRRLRIMVFCAIAVSGASVLDAAEDERCATAQPESGEATSVSNDKIFMLLPFFAAGRGDLFILNYYRLNHRDSFATGVFPLFHFRRDAEGYGFRAPLLPPLIEHSRDGEQTESSLLLISEMKRSPEQFDAWVLPVFRLTRNPDVHRTWLLPFFDTVSSQTEVIQRDTGIFPFWWSSYEKRPKGMIRSLVVLPFIHERGTFFKSDGIVPFWYQEAQSNTRGEVLRTFWALPVLRREGSGKSSFGVFPLFITSRIEDEKETTRTLSLMWPMYRHTICSRAGEPPSSSRRVLFVERNRQPTGTASWRCFGMPRERCK